MSEVACSRCGNPTNSPDRICAVCKVDAVIKEKIGGKMAAPKDRQCKNEGCEKFGVKKGYCTRHFNEAHGIKKQIGRKPNQEKEEKKKSQVSHEGGTPVTPKHIGPKVGRESEPKKKDNSTYIINVDFTRYPKLHASLLKHADEEIRNPGDQLMYMLRNTLSKMEARA